MRNSKLAKILNIKYPIFQGGMAWVATAELAAAVSNAGGLGIIGSGMMTGELVRQEVLKVRKLTDKPFGVNVILLSPFIEEVIEVLTELRVPVVTTGAGNPGPFIPKLKAAGIKVIPVVPSVFLAKRLERLGVDAVIAEGMEAGGHIGELTTLVLVPQIVDAVKIPVIAAGGIADGRGIAAAFALGAAGVQLGTRFICTEECTVHEAYKQAIIKAKDRSTVVTGMKTGHPVRVLKNKLSRQFLELENSGASKEEIENLGVGKLRAAAQDGDIENGSVMAGQIAGLVRDIKPVQEVIEELVLHTEQVLANLYQQRGQ
ncbi:MAG TPA: enoyl-[acyl-carrier-protein] reductase FabK [Clostridia bacterium]|nr:enoyl-[acyl-carrier-protein] reductase FabK [Clostridia bacterium]